MADSGGMKGRREVDGLLADLGKYIGIPDLVLDGNDYCCLSFDDHVLNLEYDDKPGELLIYSSVGEIPARADRDFFVRLLEANYASAASGVGTLAVDSENARVIWLDRIVLRAMTQDMFQEALKRAVDRVEFWKGTLADRNFHAGVADSADTLSVEPTMIRL